MTKTNLNCIQNCINNKFNHLFFFPFERCDMIFTWSCFTFYVVSSFTGYADDIFDDISIDSHLKIKILRKI